MDGVKKGSPKVNGVSERFLDLLQIPLVAGRGLEARDLMGAHVAVINQSAAQRLFGGGPALGRRFRWAQEDGWDVRVVGIVKDAKYDHLKGDPPPTLYVPWTQMSIWYAGAVEFRSAHGGRSECGDGGRPAGSPRRPMPRFP